MVATSAGWLGVAAHGFVRPACLTCDRRRDGVINMSRVRTCAASDAERRQRMGAAELKQP